MVEDNRPLAISFFILGLCFNLLDYVQANGLEIPLLSPILETSLKEKRIR